MTIRPGKHVPVEPGFWVAVFMDLAVFSAFFIAILVRRFESDASYQEFATSAQSLDQGIGLANTLVLVTSSLFVARAVVLLRALETTRARRQLMLGILLGCSFIGLKFYEYYEKLGAGTTATSNDFYNLYFVTTGLHLFHVFIGVLLLTFILKGTGKEIEGGISFAWVEAGGCYWHMVDLLWFVLFALFYLVVRAQ
jgi:nitric oxide reductase NorE protein